MSACAPVFSQRGAPPHVVDMLALVNDRLCASNAPARAVARCFGIPAEVLEDGTVVVTEPDHECVQAVEVSPVAGSDQTELVWLRLTPAGELTVGDLADVFGPYDVGLRQDWDDPTDVLFDVERPGDSYACLVVARLGMGDIPVDETAAVRTLMFRRDAVAA